MTQPEGDALRIDGVMAEDRCRDCWVEPGQVHEDGCDVARCVWTGHQRLACGALLADDGHECTNDVWSGTWPGEAECREYGLWAYFVPNGNPSWRPCSADHPGARPDLSRLVFEGWWDRDTKRWRWPRPPRDVAST